MALLERAAAENAGQRFFHSASDGTAPAANSNPVLQQIPLESRCCQKSGAGERGPIEISGVLLVRASQLCGTSRLPSAARSFFAPVSSSYLWVGARALLSASP